MRKILILILLFSFSAFAQEKFKITDTSKNYDVKIDVEDCKVKGCEGRVTFSFFKKSWHKPFQIIKVNLLNQVVKERIETAVSFNDYNFDGFEDLSLTDGRLAGYGITSKQIFIFSNKSKRFVFSPAFTKVSHYGLGMEVNKKKRVLEVFNKSGCCWHQDSEFKVINNQPLKIYEITRNSLINSI
jgi:hypothetical protein